MVTLTLTLGIPGSGKSTWANQQNQPVVTLDAIRNPGTTLAYVMQQARATITQHLTAGTDCIVDACSTQPNQRRAWLDIATQHQAHTRLVIIDCPPHLARARNATRPRPVPTYRIKQYETDLARALHAIHHEPWDTIEYAKPVATQQIPNHPTEADEW
jgi:predicted kinase